MNKLLKKTAAFAAALLIAQAAVPMSGISAIGSGPGNEVLTEYTESAVFAHRSGQYGYFYAEPEKAKAEFLEDGCLKLSWDTDSRVTAGSNIMRGINGVPLDKLPLKENFTIDSRYMLKLSDVSGFAAYGTDLQFSAGDEHKEILIADGYTEEDFPYDITPQTVMLGDDEYKIYQYSEVEKGNDIDFEQQVYIALPSVNSYRDSQLLTGRGKEISELIDSLIEAELVSTEEVLESSGFGIMIPADREHTASGNAELLYCYNSVKALSDGYNKNETIEEYGVITNFNKGSDTAYLFTNRKDGEVTGFECLWDSSDEVSAETGKMVYREITPLTEAVIEDTYDADITLEKGGLILGALCTFAGNVTPYSGENVYRAFIADICSDWNSENLQSLGSVTANGTKYDIYLERGKMIYAVPSDKKDSTVVSGVYSGKIDVMAVLKAMAGEGYIDGNTLITSVYTRFKTITEPDANVQDIKVSKGKINLNNYLNIFKSDFTDITSYNPKFLCEYKAKEFGGTVSAPSSFTVLWEDESYPEMYIKREFDLKDGWDAYGELTAEYDIDYKGTDKNSSFCFQIFGAAKSSDGKVKDEFCIIEAWDNITPIRGVNFPDGPGKNTTAEIDGVMYDIYFLPYNTQIPNGGGTYCSVSRENPTDRDHTAKIKNSISVSKHMEEWRKLGFTDGDKCELGIDLSASSVRKTEIRINSYDVYGSNEKDSAVKGDADGNGIINSIDMITLVGYLSGNSGVSIKDSADMNSDGVVNVLDLILLKKILLTLT